MRESTLNETYKDTWVSEGMDKRVMNLGLAANHVEPELSEEQERAERRAEAWLKDQEKQQNAELNLRDPPINMGKYWKDLCTVNENAYVDYKRLGAKETALLEISRHRNKIQLQEAAAHRGI